MPITFASLKRWFKRSWHRRVPLGTSLLILGTVILLVLSISTYRYLERSVPVVFRTTIQTQSLSFTLGDWPDSAGIFNSDIARVDLSLLTPTTLISERGIRRNCARDAQFAGVALLSTATSNNLHVALDVEADGALRYSLTQPTSGSDPLVSIAVDRLSNLKGLACDSSDPTVPDGEWQISPTDPGDPMEFLVRFPPHSGAPAAERNIPLHDGSSVLFQGESGLSGAANEIHLLHTGRTLKVAEGLSLVGTSHVSIQSLSYDRASQVLVATVGGSADSVAIKVGEDQVSETETNATTKHIGRLAAWFSGLTTLVGALTTIVGAVITVRGQGK